MVFFIAISIIKQDRRLIFGMQLDFNITKLAERAFSLVQKQEIIVQLRLFTNRRGWRIKNCFRR